MGNKLFGRKKTKRCKNNKTKQELQEQKMAMIDKYLAELQQQRHQSTISILLLGTSASGKSTILKQLEKIYRSRIQNKLLKDAAEYIRYNILEYIYTLSTQHQLLKTYHTELKLSEETQTICAYINSRKGAHLHECELTHDLAQQISMLWNDNGLQKTYQLITKQNIMHNAHYFFNNIHRIASDKYIPTFEDYVRVHRTEGGIIECEFPDQLEWLRGILKQKQMNLQHFVDGYIRRIQVLIRQNIPFDINRVCCMYYGELDAWKLRVTDIGGARYMRKRWVRCFTDIDAIIYVMSLSEYNQTLWTDSSQNCYREALDAFEYTIRHEALECVDFIVLFNKYDQFVAKIQQVPFSAFDPNFDKDLMYNANAVIDYLKQEYTKIFCDGVKYEPSRRRIYFDVISAIDTNQIENVMQWIRVEIRKRMLLRSNDRVRN